MHKRGLRRVSAFSGGGNRVVSSVFYRSLAAMASSVLSEETSTYTRERFCSTSSIRHVHAPITFGFGSSRRLTIAPGLQHPLVSSLAGSLVLGEPAQPEFGSSDSEFTRRTFSRAAALLLVSPAVAGH